MRKHLLLFFVMFASVLSLSAQDDASVENAVITIKTNKAVDTELTIEGYAIDSKDALTVDWGDGEEKTYFPSNLWNTNVSAKGTLKGETVKISGNMRTLEIKGAGVTSFECASAPNLEELNLSDNALTAFTVSNMPKLKSLKLEKNAISFYGDLNIQEAAPTLTELNVSDNQLNSYDLSKFKKLEYFYANNNPKLTTVLFPNGSENLKEIKMNKCDIVHFYAISLPSLRVLELGSNSIWQDANIMGFEDGTYPKLTNLDLSNNDIYAINLSIYPALENVNVSGNHISRLTVGTLENLISLNCSNNELPQLNVTANKQLSNLYCAGNQLTSLDITPLSYMRSLDISNNPISNIDLSNAYGLTDFTATDTHCAAFDFRGLKPYGNVNKLDVRNNKNMTAQSLNMMFLTMPARSRQSWTTTLFIEGCPGAEQCNTDDITSSDYNWKADVKGDGSATKKNVNLTVDATNTGKKDNFGDESSTDETYSLTRYATENGEFNLTQWTGPYYAKHADLTSTAESGVPAWVVAYPAEGYRLKEVLVNGKAVNGTRFVPVDNSTVKVVFEKKPREVKLTTEKGTMLNFGVKTAVTTPVSVCWGSGEPELYVVKAGETYYFDENAIGTDVTIYGDITSLIADSYPDSEDIGLNGDNKISAVDLSGNELLTKVVLYGNPISSIDVSNLVNLEHLDVATVGGGVLETVNLGNNPKLTELLCYNNKIASLDLTKCPELVKVDAKNNQLVDINLANNSKLQLLDLTNNQLSDIDVSNLTALTDLLLTGNKLTKLDMSKNTGLIELRVGTNKLTQLDLSNNTKLMVVTFQNNYMHHLDLSACSNLRQVNCGNNGMSACELDDFFYTLPQYPDISADEAIQGATLRLNEGEEERPNSYDTCDSSIAESKGWTLNAGGNASGCETAYITIIGSPDGTTRFFDADNNEVKSGDKVLKNSTIRVEATPNAGFKYDGLRIDGVIKAKAKSFKVLRYTKVEVGYSPSSTGIDNVTAAELGTEVKAGNGTIAVTAAAETAAQVYTANGQLVDSADVNGTHTFAAKAGAYIVKLTANGKNAVSKIVVK